MASILRYFNELRTWSVIGTADLPLLPYWPVTNAMDPAFGVTGNGTTDDTAGLQAAITAATAANGDLFVPAGSYSISRLNLTNLQQFRFSGAGWNKTTFFPRAGAPSYGTATGHVFDLTGSLNVTLEDFQIGAFNAVPAPTTGIFQAQVASGASNANIIRNVYISGPFTVATYYNYGVPSSQIYSAKFYNYQPGAGTQAVGYFTATNAATLSSDFATVTSGTLSVSDIDIFGCEWHKFAGAGANNAVIQFDQPASLRFYGGVISGGATSYINAQTGAIGTLLFLGTTFETESQPVTPTFVINLASGAVLNGLTFKQCVYIVGTGVMGGAGSFVTAGDGTSLTFTSGGALAAATTYFLGTGTNDTSSAANVQVTITEKGILLNLWVNTSASPAQTPGYTITVLINGSATALTGVISGSNTQVKDQTHFVAVNVGDTVCIRFVTAAGASSTRASASVTFLPTG